MRDVSVALVVAAAENDVIGRNNALPWYLPADLQRFKRLTLGKPILMGRRTFESIGRPLPGRSNIVITRDSAFNADGVRTVGSLDEALTLGEAIALIDGAEQLMVIGGAEIYALALSGADQLFLTRVHQQVEGDVCLPEIDWTQWRETGREYHPAQDDRPAYSFLDYTRRSQ